jgi:CRISPR-associated protein (TIGR02710 family)
MKVVDLGNPDDSIGMMAAQRPVVLFNRGDFEGAAQAFATIKPNLAAPRHLYESLRNISGALARWDRFDHYNDSKVHTSLRDDAQEARNAADELKMTEVTQWTGSIERLADQIERVCTEKKPSLVAIADLCANASRKLCQGRYEDAGARLYRALEAIAQWMLHKKEVKASDVNWSQIPNAAQERFRESRRDKTAPLPTKLGLTEAFLLARALDCEGIEHFFDDQGFVLNDEIEIRNQSILAHGWTPATKDKVERFHDEVRSKLKVLGADLEHWTVPRLPNLWQ